MITPIKLAFDIPPEISLPYFNLQDLFPVVVLTGNENKRFLAFPLKHPASI